METPTSQWLRDNARLCPKDCVICQDHLSAIRSLPDAKIFGLVQENLRRHLIAKHIKVQA